MRPPTPTQDNIQGIMDINWQEFAVSQLDNEFMIGMLAFGLLGGLLYQLRSIPNKIYTLLKFQLTTYIVIRSEDELFNYVNRWLQDTPYMSTRCRRMQSVLMYDDELEMMVPVTTPAEGAHLLMFGGIPISVERKVDESRVNGGRKETLTLTQIGRRPKTIKKIVNQAVDRFGEKNTISTSVYNIKQGYWCTSIVKDVRTFETLFIPEEQETRIKEDIKWFYENEKWYIERGIPYHRGYLFTGPPGTGKTSTISVLAGHFNKNVYLLNIAALNSDDDLFDAMRGIHYNSLLILEDIDACIGTSSRTDEQGVNIKGVTLSAILNCLDGLGSKVGLVTIMTTNHPEKLDSALVRPGRVDLKENFDLMGEEERIRMFKFFYPEAKDYIVNRFCLHSKNKSPAELQQLFIIHRDNPQDVITELGGYSDE